MVPAVGAGFGSCSLLSEEVSAAAMGAAGAGGVVAGACTRF